MADRHPFRIRAWAVFDDSKGYEALNAFKVNSRG
jgi:hypothetical protein